MTQRNPMNERYTTDKKRSGVTRKSAASAKPKSTAAASVHAASKKKPRSSRGKANSNKNSKREERNKQYEAERKYGDPPTKRFKIYKRIWMGSLICAILMVAMTFLYSKIDGLPEGGNMIFLGLAYVFIIISLYFDFGKVRKERKRYAAQMRSINSKEERAEQKRQNAQARAAKKEAEMRRIEEEKNQKEHPDQFNRSNGFDKLKTFLKLK